MHHAQIRLMLTESASKESVPKALPLRSNSPSGTRNPQLGNWKDWTEAIRADTRQPESRQKLECLQPGKRISSKRPA